MHAALLDALAQLNAGRFLRARKSAQAVLAQEKSLAASGEQPAYGTQIRALAHLLAAESAQALQDKTSRDEHLREALDQAALHEYIDTLQLGMAEIHEAIAATWFRHEPKRRGLRAVAAAAPASSA